MPAQGDTHTEIADLYRLLVDRVVDYAIFALDPAGNVLSWNAGAERLKGYHADEIIGKHFSIFYPPEALAVDRPGEELQIASATGRVEDEGWRLRKDGTRFWANVLITALRDDDGQLLGFAKVTRDLTERRAAHERAIADARQLASEEAARLAAEQRERELRELSDELSAQADELERQRHVAETANRAKSEFLAAMSHELRTPLNAIGGYAQLIQLGLSGPVTDEQLKQLDRVQRSQQHLLNVINDILNFSRMEAGRITYDIRPLSVRDAVDSVAPIIEPMATGLGISLRVAECGPDTAALGDRAKLDQILINLLSNAVKFTARGGSIDLSCGSSGESVWLKVHDTGSGIPAEHLETIFEPFEQVDRSLASPKEGTGLGLTISRDLARGMGGDLIAESKVGVGSTFTLTLPRSCI